MTIHFEKLTLKVSEFLMCAQVLNARGLADVATEAVEVIRAAMDDGYTLAKFIEEAEKLAGEKIPEGDPLFGRIKEWFSVAKELSENVTGTNGKEN